MILIKNLRIQNPTGPPSSETHLLIENGSIHSIGRHLETASLGENTQVLDAQGKTAIPGLVDVHVHFRDPGFTAKENLHTGAAAAAAGGYTTVVTMANTSPVVDNVDTLQDVIRRSQDLGLRLLPCASVTTGMKGKILVPMEELHAAGAVGFTDDGIPLMDTALLRKAMALCHDLGVPLSLHEEDPHLILHNGIHRELAKKLGYEGSPEEAESSMVARDCMISLATGYPVHLQHISSAASVHILRLAKKLGAPITAEVTPHHFTLTQEALLQHQSNAKMNPPLRTEKDRQEILQGLQDGTLDLIATDHAPHTKEEKERSLLQAPSGIIGLQTALPLAITHLVQTGLLTLQDVLQRMAVAPAKLYRLEEPLIAPGKRADLCILDLNHPFVFSPESNLSRSANSPFFGKTLYGQICLTICHGKIIYTREKLR